MSGLIKVALRMTDGSKQLWHVNDDASLANIRAYLPTQFPLMKTLLIEVAPPQPINQPQPQEVA